MKRNRSAQSHRYYCQNCIKPPIKVDGRAKTLDIPYERFEDIPGGRDGQRYYVGQLIRYGYMAYYKLLDVPPKETITGRPLAKRTRVKRIKPAVSKLPVIPKRQLNLF